MYSASEARGDGAPEGVGTWRAPHLACHATYPGFFDPSALGGPGGAMADGGGRHLRLGLNGRVTVTLRTARGSGW